MHRLANRLISGGPRVVLTLATVLLFGFGLPAGAAPPICNADSLPPGTSGCLPTPLECATGKYNGHWDGGFPGRFADCVGGGGHVVHYEGGFAGNDKYGACGSIIDNDQCRHRLGVARSQRLSTSIR